MSEVHGQNGHVLVVDDDPYVLRPLSLFLQMEGYRVVTSASAREARQLLEEGPFHVVLSDVSMPGEDGFQLLEYVRGRWPAVPVVLITGYGSIPDAVRAMRAGAYDYVTKPVLDDEVKLMLERALAHRRLLLENLQLRRELGASFKFDQFIYADPAMERVVGVLRRVADTQATVLLTGESGTGKSLVAQALHANSARRDGPFVEVNCGALPETLLESELFGHVRGAFSGAVDARVGKFQAAHGGTLFLDEISAASPALQVKLLRVLETHRFEPVGSNDTAEVDVRVVLATNTDLEELVERGELRRDLYYRINVVNVLLPPLRERPADTPLLAAHCLRRCRQSDGLEVTGFADGVLEAFQAYCWPGNVRQLFNVIYRAALLSPGEIITSQGLPAELAALVADAPAAPAPLPDPGELPAQGGLRAARDAWERALIAQVLASVGGSRKEAAALLEINRATLFNKIRQYGLK